MEYFDVLNKERKFINKILPRGTKLNSDEFNQGVEVWIKTQNKKILITQRSIFKSHPLQWEAPGGCSVSGETTITTAIREMHEEIGISINSNDLIFLGTQLYKNQFVDIYSIELNICIKKLILQSSEVSDIKLVSQKDFEMLINQNQVVPYTIQHYNNIVKKQLWNF